MNTMKDKNICDWCNGSAPGLYPVSRSPILRSQTTSFHHSFTSYWCRWYDQYKNSPPLFTWRLRLMVRTPPFHGGNVAFKSHRRHHHPLFFLLSFRRRPVWPTNPTGLIWCFLLRVGNRPLKTEMRGSIPASITTIFKLEAYIL